MNYRFASVILATVVMTISHGSAEVQPQYRHFVGLWEGVDINDGSQRTVSITDRDGDGVYEVDSRDTYWTLCDGDRGLERATGAVRGDGVLETAGLVTCFDGAQAVPVQQTYEFSKREDTLLATPYDTPLQGITLHRISGGIGARP
jgi:hypothetical protein